MALHNTIVNLSGWQFVRMTICPSDILSGWHFVRVTFCPDPFMSMFNDIFGKNAHPLGNNPTCSFPITLLFVIHQLLLLLCSRATNGGGGGGGCSTALSDTLFWGMGVTKLNNLFTKILQRMMTHPSGRPYSKHFTIGQETPPPPPHNPH